MVLLCSRYCINYPYARFELILNIEVLVTVSKFFLVVLNPRFRVSSITF